MSLCVSKVVGQKAPNAWGIYDMHGNVSEICLDLYEDFTSAPVTDPIGGYSGGGSSGAVTNIRSGRASGYGSDYFVARGGSFNDYSQNCRSASRKKLSSYEVEENSSIGFRVVLSYYEPQQGYESGEHEAK